MTALMLAVATDRPNLETVRRLIAAGANANAKDQFGDSVLDWALKFGYPEVIATLRQAGARATSPPLAPVRPPDFKPAGPADAIERASVLLAKSGEVFFTAGGGCVGCHHQALNARALGALRTAGLKPDERLRRTFLDSMLAERPGLLTDSPFSLAIGAIPTPCSMRSSPYATWVRRPVHRPMPSFTIWLHAKIPRAPGRDRPAHAHPWSRARSRGPGPYARRKPMAGRPGTKNSTSASSAAAGGCSPLARRPVTKKPTGSRDFVTLAHSKPSSVRRPSPW